MSLDPCGRWYSVPMTEMAQHAYAVTQTHTFCTVKHFFFEKKNEENYLQHYENYLQVHLHCPCRPRLSLNTLLLVSRRLRRTYLERLK